MSPRSVGLETEKEKGTMLGRNVNVIDKVGNRTSGKMSTMRRRKYISRLSCNSQTSHTGKLEMHRQTTKPLAGLIRLHVLTTLKCLRIVEMA